MTFVIPPTFAPGPPAITDVNMNQYVRDNLKAMITAARGVRTTGAAVVGNSVFSFDGVTRDPQGMWSAGTASRITVPIAGKYRVTGRMGGSSTTTATLNIRKNGVTVVITGTSGTGNLSVGEYEITLAASDYLELWLTNTGTYTLAANIIGTLVADLVVSWVAP